MRLLSWVSGIFLVSAALAGLRAEVRVSGQVAGRWRADLSPYVVVGNIFVNSRDSLIIEPGVTVQFAGNYRFDVNGTLWAIGTEQDSIIFTAESAQPGSWRAIFLTGLSAQGSELRFVSIRYPYRGLEISDASPRVISCTILHTQDNGIRLNRSAAEIAYTSIGGVGTTGIAVTNQSRPTISHCTITQCEDHGIGVIEGSMPIIQDNFISSTSDYGIHINGAGSTTVKGNTVDLSGVRGISIWETNSILVERNVVLSSQGVGIWLYRSSRITLLNNTVLFNQGHGIHLSVVDGQAVNNLIFQNRGAGFFADRSQVLVKYNDVWANNPNYYGIQRGENDISEDPRLIDPGRYNFWPSQDSPVIDAGDPQSPPDPDGTRADIGAYFYNQNHPPIITSYEPEQLEVAPGDSHITFRITAEDPDGHPLSAIWSVNGREEGAGFTFRRLFNRDGNYEVMVVVDDGYYQGRTSHSWTFRVQGSGIVEETIPNGFFISPIYPNPFNSFYQFYFITSHPTTLTGELRDGQGRLLRSFRWNISGAGEWRITENMTPFPSGTYILMLNGEGYRTLRQLIYLK